MSAEARDVSPKRVSTKMRKRTVKPLSARYQLSLIPSALDPQSHIILGDALTELRTLPAGSVRCCVTSPPYWGLRDYGIEHQIGAERDLNKYLTQLVAVFDEVKRVLTDDGTLWLNIGDGYTSGDRTWRDADKKNEARGMDYRPPTPAGLKPKDLLGVPWRLAFKLQEAGWYLRADIVWHKPNAQPESVKDRPTRAHEYIFLLSKKEKAYYYDYAAMQVPAMQDGKPTGKTRNVRTVWDINTEPYPEAHFATFPPALIRPCIRAGSQEGDAILDPFFGSGTLGVVCTELGRHYIGIELNPDYVNLAKRRLGWPIDPVLGPVNDREEGQAIERPELAEVESLMRSQD